MCLLLFGGLLPLSNWLILPLEQRFARADLAGRDVDGIVVLGGGEDSRIWIGRGAHALNDAGERFTEAMALARRYPKAKVVFTGGSIEILSRPTVGADAARAIFGDLGLVEGERLAAGDQGARHLGERRLHASAGAAQARESAGCW